MSFGSPRRRRRLGLGDSYVGTPVLDYVLQSNSAGLIGTPIYNSYDGVEQPVQYIGYPNGVTPPEVLALQAQGHQPDEAGYYYLLQAALKANGRAFKPAGVVIDGSTTFTPAPVVPVTGPETYLEGGVTYTNYDDAAAALQAAPPPPAATTGTIHYDPDTDSYLEGAADPTVPEQLLGPSAVSVVVDPAPTGGTPFFSSANEFGSWATGAKVAIGVGLVGGLAWLSTRTGRRR